MIPVQTSEQVPSIAFKTVSAFMYDELMLQRRCLACVKAKRCLLETLVKTSMVQMMQARITMQGCVSSRQNIINVD